jgi:AMP-binding enzyme
MGHVPVARAQALPGRSAAPVRASAWQAVARHARDRADDVAYVLAEPSGPVPRTWAEVADAVERAAAGLVRSGLRVDQVVVSLLPSDHAHPELDLALRTVGAVVVHVGPDAGADDLARELAGVDVRLVVAEGADDVARLDGIPLSRAELFTLDGGRGWARLLELGAERLVMDPEVVQRADSIVDPDGAEPRFFSGTTPLVRAPRTSLRDGVFDPRALALVAGGPADPLLHVVRETHLSVGFTLCVVQDADRLRDVAAHTRPTVLVVPEQRAEVLPGVLAVLAPPTPTPRRSRGWRSGAGRTAGSAASAARGPLVVTPAPSEEVRASVAALGGAVEVADLADPRPADLPEPPPVVMGDPTLLPRRARRSPGDDFGLRLEPEVDASAFLPSLPLMSGESFLDQLLLSRARQAPE